MNKNSEIVDRVQTLNGEVKWLNERQIGLQTRSMRGKLNIFDGIQEQAEENTERVLKTFIKKLKFHIHIVHRMLKKIQGKHRPIENTYGEQHRGNWKISHMEWTNSSREYQRKIKKTAAARGKARNNVGGQAIRHWETCTCTNSPNQKNLKQDHTIRTPRHHPPGPKAMRQRNVRTTFEGHAKIRGKSTNSFPIELNVNLDTPG